MATQENHAKDASTKPNELLEKAANSSSKEGVDVNREEGWSSVTRKKKDLGGLKSPARTVGAKYLPSTNAYVVLMVDDQVATTNKEKEIKHKEGLMVVVRDEKHDSSNSSTPTKVNLTAMGVKILENLNLYQGLPGFLAISTKGFHAKR